MGSFDPDRVHPLEYEREMISTLSERLKSVAR